MICRYEIALVMKSTNFEFIRNVCPELANLGAFAETYAYSDPSSAMVKLRTFAEAMVSAIFAHHQFSRPYQDNLYDLLDDPSFKKATPCVVIDKLHILRIRGNKAAHGSREFATAEEALSLIREAHSLAQWFFISFAGGTRDECKAFQQPPQADEDTKGQLKRDKRAALERLAAQEAQMAQLLADLESTRRKAEAAEKTADELQAILDQAQQAANILEFSEEKTRKTLIDEQLIAAGWMVGASGINTPAVRQEFPVKFQPTATGDGFIDYVLWDTDSDKPVAIVEAKKTAHDARKGKKQASCYADGIERMYGQRPVIFYTNGFEIYLWDDAKGAPPRQLHGFYSIESLNACIAQRTRGPLGEYSPKETIVNRLYQFEAIANVRQRLDNRHRRMLLVMATGTGKTRVAVALCDVLIRAGWVKRVLFLSDRRELRKQAHNVFKEHLPSEPRVYLTEQTAQDPNQRIYLATYPAMMKCFQRFDVGFFDLVIADESHRSIYNRYRPLLEYFDAIRVGLTATPVKYIYRNTYKLFGCEVDDPTFNYPYDLAINHNPPYLSRFEVAKVTTKFLREGIHYKNLSREQREQIEEQVDNAEDFDAEPEDIASEVYSKDTDRHILRNLMENGIRDSDGQRLGKTIVFARNHKHAVLLNDLFDEMYPQYGGYFCAVIDNYDPRAEQLIDDFKGEGQRKDKEIVIAISVDMLDTGIDVPEVVNLVFAKPVRSFVKFWQMIGRGTRICKDLFGSGLDKTSFMIFDHWGNFEYFDEGYQEVEPARPLSLMQSLFEQRIALAETAVEKQDFDAFGLAVELLGKDLAALPEETLAVREKWREKRSLERPEVLKAFAPATRALLRHDMAPLMCWRNLEGHEPAYRFDLLVAKMQTALLKNSAQLQDHKDTFIEHVTQLPLTLVQVQEKRPTIDKVKTQEFWKGLTVHELDKVRCDLRGLMVHRQKPIYPEHEPLYLDVKDGGLEYRAHAVKLDGLDLAAYRFRVEKVLRDMLDRSPVLRKIKAAEPVTEAELTDLTREMLLLDPELTTDTLLDNFANNSGRLDLAIRRILGLNPDRVDAFFADFVQKYPQMTSHQMRFVDMLKSYVARYGTIEIEKLWDAPFTTINSGGVDAVFEDGTQVDDLIHTLETINAA
jgi:type I restriction enzyme, R subunit